MALKEKKKIYVIDPEPMMSAWGCLLLFLCTCISEALIGFLLRDSLSIYTVSILIELGVYSVPVIVIAIITAYPIRNIFRWNNFLRTDLNLIIIISAISLVAITVGLSGIIQKFAPLSQEQLLWKQKLLQPEGNVPFYLIFIAVALIPGICEELLFRGLIQPALIKNIGAVPGVICTSILFATAHFNAQEIIPLFLLGLFLGIAAYRAGSLLYAALGHIIFNGSAVTWASLEKWQGISLQAGGFSVTILFVIVLVFSALMIIFFWITPKRVIGEPIMYHI